MADRKIGKGQGTRMADWKTYRLGGGGADGAADLDSEAFETTVEREWFACRVDRRR